MSTSGPFDTGYVGAHRWHVECPQGAYVWTCICGDTGRAVGNLAFCLDSFARHAHEALQEAATALLGQQTNHIPTEVIQLWVGQLRTKGENDKANLWQLIVNRREEAEQG